LWRRLTAAGVTTIAAYLRYLDEHPEEEQRLIADFLIKVTRFFRDPELFTRLREDVIPELVATAQGGRRELRIWSAGCATGEEAYSLALLVVEAMGTAGDTIPVRIFATDLDDLALDFARRGVYPSTTLLDVPPELVAQHFTEQDGAFEISQDVRSLIVFGRHDLAQRPPFPRMDLVVCRNVLIYFTPELQRRALEIFAYSLREDGYLVLGKSETTGPAKDAFRAVDRRLRLYRRHGDRPRLPPALQGKPIDLMRSGGAPLARSSSVLEVALRQAEDATSDARRSGERSEELVRRLPIGVAVVTRTYDLRTINGAARELLGIHGLALGQDLIHLVAPSFSAPLRIGIDAVFAGEPAHEIPAIVTVETATGEIRHLRVRCHPQHIDASGVVKTVLLLIDDVTAIVEAERANAKAAAEQAAEAAAQRETAQRLAEANRRLIDANRELADTVDRLREQSDELRTAIAAAQVSSEEIETLNEELQSSNEELETLHEEAQATVEELNVSNDELQARARELEELAATHAMEQERLSAVLAGMGDAVLVVDHQGKVVRTNAAYDELLRSLGGVLTPADENGVPLPEELTPVRRVARGEAFRVEFTAGWSAGDRRWFEATGRPVSRDSAGVLVIRDITDRTVRRLQEEFLTWAGHELRTPLTTLQGYLQLAERRLPADADERLRRYLTVAIEESRRQGTLIAELIDATRLHSGKIDLSKDPVDLVQIVAHTVELAQVLAQGQSIALEAGDKPVMVAGDAGRLEQVLLNLLTNAIAYAPGTERIDVHVRQTADVAEITVRDTGPGIPVEAQETIFDRFTQVNPAERPGRAGLGLGLYIAREIVAAHGGTIAAFSIPGEGATFTIRLPLLGTQTAGPSL
jgi:two-component system CheB/CheR fusion protein